MIAPEKKIISALVQWYGENKRSLPWRETRDPFKIWVSEVILQQTRVDQGLPYYHRFIKSFPDVKKLAAANQEKVLRLWQGLGYYSRARNMHRCAKQVLVQYEGIFPKTYSNLIELPGVGPYTAAAVSSIAADEPQPVIDGNVFRVLARIFGIDQPINTPAGKKLFSKKAATLMSIVVREKISPGEYNQALMEFGALQCVPRQPDCDSCPLAKFCTARAQGLQGDLPVKLQLIKKRDRHLNYLILEYSGKIWMKKREAGDVWQGLFDFFLLETPTLGNAAVLKKKFTSLIGDFSDFRHLYSTKHLLSHQRLHAQFYYCSLKRRPPQNFLVNGTFVTIRQANQLPKPIIIERVLSIWKKNNV
ncbi:MAG: A/G-specific adenine glycosylase [Cyclobacteriaceae bacterium]